jgi:hypothetical protein
MSGRAATVILFIHVGVIQRSRGSSVYPFPSVDVLRATGPSMDALSSSDLSWLLWMCVPATISRSPWAPRYLPVEPPLCCCAVRWRSFGTADVADGDDGLRGIVECLDAAYKEFRPRSDALTLGGSRAWRRAVP